MFLPPSCGRSHAQTCRTPRSTLREHPAMEIEMTVFVLKLRCETRFQRAFNAYGCVFKGITLVTPTNVISLKTQLDERVSLLGRAR
jgi:hypothetical protein